MKLLWENLTIKTEDIYESQLCIELTVVSHGTQAWNWMSLEQRMLYCVVLWLSLKSIKISDAILRYIKWKCINKKFLKWSKISFNTFLVSFKLRGRFFQMLVFAMASRTHIFQFSFCGMKCEAWVSLRFLPKTVKTLTKMKHQIRMLEFEKY